MSSKAARRHDSFRDCFEKGAGPLKSRSPVPVSKQSLVGTAVMVWVTLAWAALPVAKGQNPVLDDPVPLQRVAIPLSRLPAELEKVRQGTLVQMPRQEFEALVQRAARGKEAGVGNARIIKAQYSAELVGNSLVRGSGQWTIQRTGLGLTLLPLPSFNLALDKVRWSGGTNAILGKLDGANFSLFVDRPEALSFDWSLRGEPVTDGLQFDLQLPPCPVGVLELTVPADHQIHVGKNGALLSELGSPEQPGKRVWRLEFSGRSQVEIKMRRPAEGRNIPPLFLTQVQTKQVLTPERMTADYEFQVDILHTTVRELVFDCDPSLQPYEVSLLSGVLKDWEYKVAPPPQKAPGKKGNAVQKPATLVVRLREPFQGTLPGLRIRCLGPSPASAAWTSPSLRLRQARTLAENLKISIHPELRMEAWDTAGFRLISSTTENDGNQILTLLDPAGGVAYTRRPGGKFSAQGFELHGRQQNWWHIGSKDASFVTDISYEMIYGRLSQLAIKLPVSGDPWRVEKVELEPKEALRSWVVAGSALLVDLHSDLTPAGPIKLSMRLALRPEIKATGQRSFEFPVVQPLDAAISQGALAIQVDPQFHSALEQTSMPLAPPSKEGPWPAQGTPPPQYYFEYRGQPVTGRLRLSPGDAKQDLSPEGTKTKALPEDVLPAPAAMNNVTALESAAGSCPLAHLTTYVESGNVLLHHFRLEVGNWSLPVVEVAMPPETKRLLAVKLDGHWLEGLSPGASESSRFQIKLPAIMDRAVHHYDVYYRTETVWSGWPTRAHLVANFPKLPVEPVARRRAWRLAPGLVPLHQEMLQTLSEQPDFEVALRRLWHLGDPLLAEVVPHLDEESLEPQRQVLLGAESGLRRKLTKETTLADALERLDREYIKRQLSLVLDRSALRAASISPETHLTLPAGPGNGSSRPFWEYLELVYVPFPSGPVLTTQQQWQAWQRNFGPMAQVRQAHNAAVAEAVAGEHDVLGRFVTLAAWLRTEKGTDSSAPLFVPATEGWTTWEPRAGHSDTPELAVIQEASLQTLGIISGLMWFVFAWSLRRVISVVWGFRLFVVWLFSLALLVTWCPPALQTILGSLWCSTALWFCFWLGRIYVVPAPARQRAGNSTVIARALVGSSTVWLLVMPGFWESQGRGQVNETYTVLMVESGPGQSWALLGQDLLKKLEDLDHKSDLSVEAVLHAAHYQGRMKGKLAEFTVQYDVHNFADKARLFLPLAGVDLQEGALLDGMPVLPVVSAAPKAGYVLNIAGKGTHRLVLSFTLRPAAVGDFQELRFACPRLSQNFLEWTLDSPATELKVVNCFGAESMAAKSSNNLELKANLGREATMHLRWRPSNSSALTGVTEFREAFMWNLRPGLASLTATWQFTPVKGSLSRLTLSLPEDFDVRTLDAILSNSGMNAGSTSVLKNWHFVGKGLQRQLQVDLTGPIASKVVLTLQLLPRVNMAAASVPLKLPLALTGRSTESYLAYRVEHLEAADKTQNLGVTSMGSDVFGKIWAGFGQPDSGPVYRAYSFRRTGGNSGLLLSLAAPKPKAQADVIWTCFAQHADFAATINLDSGLENFSMVEVSVPADVTLAEVRGAGVHHWNRQKSGVQIWLDQARKQAHLELKGWVPLTRKVREANELGLFHLTNLKIANIRLDSYRVQVVPRPGIDVQAENLRNLLKSEEFHTYTAFSQDYEGAFVVRLLPPQPKEQNFHKDDPLEMPTSQGSSAPKVIPDQAQRTFPPTVSLLDTRDRERATAWRRTGLLVLAAFALLLLTWSSRGLSMPTHFWPEYCLILAFVAMVGWGASLIGIFLIALVVVIRLFWALRLTRNYFMTMAQLKKDVP